MVVFVRDQNRVTFLFESGTYASPSGTSGNWIGLVTDNQLTENENYVQIRYAGTNSRNYGELVLGPEDFEGTMTFHPQNFRAVAFALGSCVDTSGTVVKHVISELNSNGRYAYTSGTSQLTNFPSFTLKDSKGGMADGQNYVRTVNGCVVDTLSIKADNGAPVVMEMTYKGQAFTLGSKTTDIVPIRDEDTTRPYMWSDAVWTIDAAVMTEINSFEFKVENNVEGRHYVNGSRVVQAFIPTMRNYTVTVDLDTNSTWFKKLSDYQKNGSVFNAQLAMSQAAAENGTFAFSGCIISDISVPTQVEGIDETTITIRPQTVSFIGSDATLLYNPY